jgi:hypothetical protein
MKSKALIVLSTLAMALALMAQSTTQTTPAPAPDSKTCACCNHDKASSQASTCGKDCCGKGTEAKAGCCQGKDGKQCPMMSKEKGDKMSCCADGKCSMTSKNGKSCCGGKMCERPQAGV